MITVEVRRSMESIENLNTPSTSSKEQVTVLSSGEQDTNLKEILPYNNAYKYNILQVENIRSNNNRSNTGINIRFTVNIKTKDEALQWLKCFQEHTKTTYTVKTTRPTTKTLVIWKCYFKCNHNTRSKNVNSKLKPNVKNTNCPSKMTMTIRAVHKRWQGKLSDKPDPDMPCIIDLDYNHNHPILNEVLRFRPVSEETKAKLLLLYNEGYSPAMALDRLKRSLEEENPETFDKLLADRYYCPDYQFCYRLFMKEFHKRKRRASS